MMADPTKHLHFHGGSIISDIKNMFSVLKTRRTVAFAYGFMFAFVAFTVFLAFNPSSNSSSPWFTNIFSTTSTTSTSSSSVQPYGSQFSSIFSYFFPTANSSTRSYYNSTVADVDDKGSSSSVNNHTQSEDKVLKANGTTVVANQTVVFDRDKVLKDNGTSVAVANQTSGSLGHKGSSGNVEKVDSKKDVVSSSNNTTSVRSPSLNKVPSSVNNQTSSDSSKAKVLEASQAGNSTKEKSNGNKMSKGSVVSNDTASVAKKKSNGTNSGVPVKQGIEDIVKSLINCNLFDGHWVRDDSYPLYKPGSCSVIDQQFNCITNGRPDKNYQKMKWKPKGCTLPRMNGTHMLELIRGKRLVFVGDSLNRNMWESLICILRSSVKDPRKVYEASGRVHFRGEASYNFIFKDYNCTVEFFVSPFLVREWEVSDKNGKKKETLRLDLVGKSCDLYKDADYIIFNTGHWWTHDKTSKGKDYYQEGSHVYGELNVLEAFRKALTTWARWIDANVNPAKSMVFFRGYSASHFSGGQWNSGGACDHETEPIKNDTYLNPYPGKMMVLEKVLRGMKTPVTYLNITRLTDYRKDGHPSIYRKVKSGLQYQDCAHWCLPGVPDAWNELFYAELLVKQYRMQLKQQQSKRP